MNINDMASLCSHRGVKEPIMLDIVIAQSTGESLYSLEMQVWQTTANGRMSKAVQAVR